MNRPPFDSRKIEPEKLGGYGKEPNLPKGGLIGKTFNAQCPPAVVKGTRIVAVAGPNDFRDNASPEMDGWFFSDFFLFHHLLKEVSGNQVWLTCVDPSTLLNKYSDFVHGNAERRIVLDQTMLPELGDVRVVDTSRDSNQNDLVELFLSTVRKEAEKSVENDQALLVLVFGHGDEDTHSITIGGNKAAESNPQLTRQAFRRAIPTKARVTMLTTSCYGGGWSQTPLLNNTTLTAVDDSHESLSWPKSRSGRFCGSRYATAVTQSLIRMSFPDWDLDEDKLQELESDESTAETFAQLAKTVRHILFEEVDKREGNSISFSAKDDKWGMEWRQRSGIALSNYEERWKSLRLLPWGSGASNISQTGSVRLADDRPLYPYQQALQLVRMKAKTYFNSHPGLDEAAKNHRLHGEAKKLLNGKDFPPEDLQRLSLALDYRQHQIMAVASALRRTLGISFPDCEDIDLSTSSGGEYQKCVSRARLFSRPQEDEGWAYAKGVVYLAMALQTTGWSLEKADSELQRLKRGVGKSPNHCHLRGIVSVSRLIICAEENQRFGLTTKGIGAERDRTVRTLLMTIGKSAKQGLRSLSPVKHGRKSLEGAFEGLSIGASGSRSYR